MPKVPSRPNVLLILTDQQSLRAMGAYGNRHVRTPNMDALAACGVRFARSYCAAPVCSASRAALVTGRMPHEIGVEVNDRPIRAGVPTLGSVFRAAGYDTAWAGKWHVPESYPAAADAIPGFRNLPVPRDPLAHLGSRMDGPTVDAAVAFLRERRDRPFLLTVSLHNPHDICAWIVGRHRDAISIPPPDLPLPPLPGNFEVALREPEFVSACRRRDHYGPENLWAAKWTPDAWRLYLHAYYRLVERVDAQVGRLIDALGACGRRDDTLIVFTSDHGEGLAAHRLVAKLLFYEEMVSVPLVVAWRGWTPEGVQDGEHLVSGLDIMPTLCDYAGVAAPEFVRGASLRPAIERPGEPGREFVAAELQPDPAQPGFKGRMVRSRRFKYAVYSEGARPEMLFDLDADPLETRDLAPDPDQHRVMAAHRAMLRSWMDRTGDDFVWPAPLRARS